MAKEVSTEQVIAALRLVQYPNYQSDIVSLGIVEGVARADNGGLVLTLRQASAREPSVFQR